MVLVLKCTRQMVKTAGLFAITVLELCHFLRSNLPFYRKRTNFNARLTLSCLSTKTSETKLLVDSSIKYGVAYVLLQISPEGKISVCEMWLVQCAQIMALLVGRGGRGCRNFMGNKSCSVLSAWGMGHLPLVKVLTGSLENLSPKLF